MPSEKVTDRQELMTTESDAGIVSQKQAERALTQEREFSQCLLESMADGVVACDANGLLTLFNRTAREWHGLDPLRLPQEEWARHYDLLRADGIAPLPTDEIPLARAFRGEIVKDAGMAIRAKGQATRYVVANGSVITGEKGDKLGAVVIMRDITGHKMMEEALRASEEKYRSVVENISIGVTMISPGMEILAQNACMQRWFPHIDVTRRPICYESYINPPRDSLCVNCPTYRTLHDGQVHDAIIETPAGDRTLYFRVLSSPIMDREGNVIAATEMVEDVTERQRTETELRRHRERLEELIGERTAELGKTNARLQAELSERKRAEESLRELTDKLEQRVRERTAELETKNADLERMNKVFVGRELKMAELKERIRELESSRTANGGSSRC